MNGHEQGRTRLGEMLAKQGNALPEPPAVVPVEAGGAAAPGPVGELLGLLPVAWETVQRLREEVSSDLEGIKKRRRSEGGGELGAEDEREAAQAAVHQRVAQAAAEHVARPGAEPWSREQLAAVRKAVLDALFLAGPIQQVLEWPGVEDVIIDRRMVVDFTDRPRQEHPTPFADEEAKVDWVNQMCARSGHRAGQLSPSRPMVDFDLPDGSRGSATLLSPSVATVALRRHQVGRASLRDLMGWGTLDGVLANFLAAAVKARFNILVAGDMGRGKTTLMRALSRFIPARERVATLEDVLELRLDQFSDGPHVVSFQSRQSNGERDARGNLIGEVSIADMVPMALRYRADRLMVGEVRSVEAVPMLEAMVSGGAGSMCTIHAVSPDEVVERLMVPVTRTGLTDTAAYRLIASAIDLVVYVDGIDERDVTDAAGRPGRMHRFISHVTEVTGRGEGSGVATGTVFAPRGDGTDPRAVWANGLTERRRKRLLREGRFDPLWVDRYPEGAWPEMTLVVPR